MPHQCAATDLSYREAPTTRSLLAGPAGRAVTASVNLNAPNFEHVLRLTDEQGMFEHADGTTPRRDGGHCLDAVARALVVVCRHRPTASTLDRLAAHYLSFVRRAQATDGRCHNRLDRYGRWEDRPDTGDWWGRALWGLGTAAARGPQSIRDSALRGFDLSVAPQPI